MARLPSLGPGGVGWVAIQGVLLVLVGAAGWSLGPDWGEPLRTIAVVVGIVLVAAGIVLAGRGMLGLGNALSPLPEPRARAELVDSGVYGFVRHPIYGGLILVAAGWSLVNTSLMALAWTIVLAGFMTLKSVREEVLLEARYPSYPAYRARTRRFIPRLF